MIIEWNSGEIPSSFFDGSVASTPPRALDFIVDGKKYLLVKTLVHDNYIYNVMNG